MVEKAEKELRTGPMPWLRTSPEFYYLIYRAFANNPTDEVAAYALHSFAIQNAVAAISEGDAFGYYEFMADAEAAHAVLLPDDMRNAGMLALGQFGSAPDVMRTGFEL